MVEPRVKAQLAVAAMLRTANGALCPGMVLRRGDGDAGAILVLLRGRAGLKLFSQTRAPDGGEAWLCLSGAEPVDDPAADALIARQEKFDPDLWVVEFETRDLTPPFAMRVIAR